mgnify:CR=1 FL=1
MATFSRTLEHTLRRALAFANEHQHEYVTLEHLLLALIDDDEASQVMHACKVDLDKLRGNLESYLETELDSLVVRDREHEEPRPTAGFRTVPESEITILPPETAGATSTGQSAEPATPSFRSEFWQEDEPPRAEAGGEPQLFTTGTGPSVTGLRNVQEPAAAVDDDTWLAALERDLFGERAGGQPPPNEDPQPVPQPIETPTPQEDPTPAPQPIKTPRPQEDPTPAPQPIETPQPQEIPGTAPQPVTTPVPPAAPPTRAAADEPADSER